MKISLRTKLLGGLAAMLLMIIVIGSVNMYLSNRTQNRLQSIINRDAKSVEIIGDLSRSVSFVHSNCLLHLFERDPDDMDRYESEIADWVSKISRNFETLKETLKDQAILDKLRATTEISWKTYLQAWNEQVKALSRTDRDEEAFDLLRKTGVAGEAFREAMYNFNELYDRIIESAGYSVKLAEQNYRKDQLILLAIIIVAIIFGLAFGLRLTSRIVGAVNRVSKAAKRVAAGDLDQKVEVKTGDEIESMADSFNIMTGKLKTMMEGEEKARKELNALNETLEQRVAERTLDLKDSNEMLMTARERLEHLLVSSPAVICTRNPLENCAITFVSENVGARFGYRAQEFINDPGLWADNIHSEDRARIFDSFSCISEQDHCTQEYRFRIKDGTYRWVYDEMQLVRDVEGTPVECVGCCIDITERKGAEEALKESEQRFRTVAEYNYDWESWVDPDGKYIYVSPSCERITGYSAEEFMKDPELFTRIVHPDDRESVSMHVQSHLDMEGTGDHHIDFRIITREDDIRWISHYCQTVHDEAGNWLGTRASNRDITGRMKLSGQLAQSQKMEGIGRLAGGIAHDFNNLLTTIIGYTDIMLKKVDKESPFRTGMEEIKLAADRAANLTGQLLAFSRKQMIHPIVLDLNYPLAEMDKMLRRLIGDDIDLITVLEPELWKVKFDPGQMDQVLMNLAVNAKDAMPEGGQLTIETANVALDEAYARQHGVEMKPGPFVNRSEIWLEQIGNLILPVDFINEINCCKCQSSH